MKHFTILLAIWTSRAFAYHLLNEDDLLSPMCGNIQAAVRVRNEDARFTIPNMTRVSLRTREYNSTASWESGCTVGELELEKMYEISRITRTRRRWRSAGRVNGRVLLC